MTLERIVEEGWGPSDDDLVLKFQVVPGGDVGVEV